MWRNRNDRDLPAVLAATVSLAAGVAVVVILTKLGLKDNQVIAVALLLLPLLVYGIASGRLTELRAPGGWGAKFSRTAGERITHREITAVEDIPVETAFRQPDKCELHRHPNAMRVTVKNSKVEVPICDYLTYVESLLASEAVKYLIFVDSSGTFLSMVPIVSISREPELTTSDGDCRADLVIEWIASKDLNRISRLRGFVWSEDAVSSNWTKRRCLEKMVQVGAEALPVVDNGKLKGIVERSQLLSSLLVEVATHLE